MFRFLMAIVGIAIAAVAFVMGYVIAAALAALFSAIWTWRCLRT